MQQPCDGVTVVDFSQSLAGALTTMFLADTGAEVITVEPPGGDPLRGHPAYLQWRRGQKSVALDLTLEDDQATARRLAARADAVIEAFRPGVAERFGVGYETLAAENPRLVYAAIRGFGERGPYASLKGYEGIVAAKAGLLLGRRPWRREGPMFDAIPRMSLGAAHLAAQGVLAALWDRDRTGRGARLEATLLAAATAHSLNGWLVPVGEEAAYAAKAEAPLQHPDPHDASTLGYTIAECKDGRWIQSASTMVHIFRNFLNLIGLSEVYDDPAMADIPYTFPSPEAKAELGARIKERLRTRTSDEWTALFLEDGGCGGERFGTVREYMEHPQAKHNGIAIEVDDPRVGRMEQIAPLVTFRDTPSRVRAPAPFLDEHRGEALALAARPLPAAGNTVDGGAHAARPPLEGVTVLELASYYAAPFGATLLADLGARVIKIEPPGGDAMRRLPESSTKTIQGKESVAVDLKTERGREIFHRLVERADALMHNFRPGADERLGLDYETVSAVNPRLVYLYAGSYGSSGPYHRQPAFHPTVSAVVGSGVRAAGRGNPPMDASHGDPDGALGVATALLLGLHAARRNGKGQYIETRMITTGAYEVSDALLDYEGCPGEPSVDAEQQGFHALYRLYRTGGNGWVFLACPKGDEWRRLCAAIGRDDLARDPRFESPDARRKHDAALAAEIEAPFAKETADEWERRLTEADVACVRADGARWSRFWLTEPWAAEQGLRTITSHPRRFEKPHYRHGPALRFEGVDLPAGPAAYIGEHTRPILAELGYDEADVSGLEADGVVLDQGPWV